MKREHTGSTPYKVLLVDDHALFRHGMKRLLEDDKRFKVVADAATGHEAIHQIEIHRPDLMVLDIQLPGLTGLTIARMASKEQANLKIVILTMHMDDERLFLAMQAGAHGYLTKDIYPDELLTGLERVASGERIIDQLVVGRPGFAAPILSKIRKGNENGADGPMSVPDALKCPLTAREAEVLDCVAQGLSNKEIGDALFISEQTVKNHMSSVLRKLSAEGRLQAVVSAHRQGWINLGSSAEYMVAD